VCVLLALSQLLASATPERVADNGRKLEGGERDQQTVTIQDKIDTDVKGEAKDTILPSLVVGSQQNTAKSCSEISELKPGQSSGYYWVRSHNGTAVQVYCDMDRVCGCSSTGGWMRIAHLNMSDVSQQCPDAWRLVTTPRRMCGRKTTQKGGCDSAIFPTHGLQYSHVCGRVRGYQYVSPYAFIGPINSIDRPYVDGVSITHGAPGSRQHVWTFAASYGPGFCPCSYNQSIPPFVGQDYFCETGNDDNVFMYRTWFVNDTLWDGQDCKGYSACECTFNGPPWFCKQLPQTTTDDVEVHICADERTGYGDTAEEVIELYIH